MITLFSFLPFFFWVNVILLVGGLITDYFLW